jgi:hypothetical protein
MSSRQHSTGALTGHCNNVGRLTGIDHIVAESKQLVLIDLTPGKRTEPNVVENQPGRTSRREESIRSATL